MYLPRTCYLWAGMRTPFLLIFVSLSLAAGIHIPITNPGHSLLRARSVGVGAIGLGDFKDMCAWPPVLLYFLADAFC